MTLNLSKHGAAMQKAWKEVLDPDNATNWALYGYEGSSFDLKLLATGEMDQPTNPFEKRKKERKNCGCDTTILGP